MRRLSLFAVLCAVFAVPSAASASALNGLTISPSIVNNGASTTGDLQMAFPDPAPTTVLLFSSAPSAAQVPASIVVPPFVQEVFFTITSTASAPFTGVQITASVDNVPRVANMSVNPAPPAGGSLNAVTLNPTSVTGGSNSTGTISFTTSMRDGASVFLTSSNPAVAQVPTETVVNANTSSGTFNVATKPVTTQTSVTITATWIGITRSTVLTVKPGAPPTADKVAIKSARCQAKVNGCLLQIEATSSNPNAILSVFNGDGGGFLFTMTNNGGGRYSLTQPTISPPARIIVKSNFGGSANATVSR
jgi:hypothetical protein